MNIEKFIQEFRIFNAYYHFKYSIRIHQDLITSDVILTMIDITTDKEVSHIAPLCDERDYRGLLEDLRKKINKKSTEEKIYPVSTILQLGIDIADNGDKAYISVCRPNGSAIEFINNITGDEAIELYKKLVGG